MPLDTRPIPRYALGFPHGVQANIIATVEEELRASSLEGSQRTILESSLAEKLDELRKLCRDHKIEVMKYQPTLDHYLAALKGLPDNTH